MLFEMTYKLPPNDFISPPKPKIGCSEGLDLKPPSTGGGGANKRPPKPPRDDGEAPSQLRWLKVYLVVKPACLHIYN